LNSSDEQARPISPSEAADRLAIRELVEAYAHCADRRDAKRQMARKLYVDWIEERALT